MSDNLVNLYPTFFVEKSRENDFYYCYYRVEQR